MSAPLLSVRGPLARLAGAALAVTLLAAGCTGAGEDPAGSDPRASATTAAAASDGGGAEAGASDGGASEGGASDGGGEGSDRQSAAAVPQEPYAATPAPDGFEPPEPCTGEGAYFAEVGKAADPALPERAGETLTIEATGIEGEKAQLRATLGDGEARDVEDLALGETVTIDLWTLSVTSVCEDTQQVEFDLID